MLDFLKRKTPAKPSEDVIDEKLMKFSTDDVDFRRILESDPALAKVYKSGFEDGLKTATLLLKQIQELKKNNAGKVL